MGYSPFDAMNALVESGLSVLAGNDPPQVLDDRLAALAASVVQLERGWLAMVEVSAAARARTERFVAVAACLREAGTTVRAWLDQGGGAPQVLTLGLQRLGQGAVALQQLLDEVRALEPPRMPAALEVERLWYRARGVGGSSDEAVQEAWRRAAAALEALDAELGAFEAAPLPEALRASFAPRQRELLASLRENLERGRTDAAALDALRRDMAGYEALHDARQAEVRAAAP